MTKNINLLNELFLKNPYQGLIFNLCKPDLQTWGGNRQTFRDLIDEFNPKLVIEVGSWKGGSAINMGKHIKSRKLNCQILCIDTWLGSLEHWNQKDPKSSRHSWYQSLKLKNGYPSLYYQFLSNVFLKRLQKIIIPFPSTSIMAFKWLKKRNIQAEIIYIDGSHEEDEVYLDVKNYYQLVKNGGVIFGDDWDWSDIRKAVRKFAKEKKLKIKLLENKLFWLLNKK